MIKFYLIEEYRRHTSIAKKYSLILFPIYVIFFVAVGASFTGYLFQIFPYKKFIMLTMVSTFIYGFGVSSFEFLGRSKEKSTLSTITTHLPISPKKNYFYIFLRDVIYYTSLFIFPTYIGLLVSIRFSNFSIFQITLFIISLMLAMFLGYSLGYLSFSLWFRNRKTYYILIVAILVYILLIITSILPFPPASFQIYKEISYFLVSILFICVIIISSYYLTPIETHEISKKRKLSLIKYSKIFKNILLAKEMEDVIRGGIIIKSIFTYFFPMLLLLLFVKIINMSMGKEVYNPMSMSVMLSIFSAVIYSWLTILEDFEYFSVLPVKSSDIVKTHIKGYLIIISIISIPIIVGFNINSLNLLPQSLGLFYLNSLYLLSITAYMAGPKITSLLFNPGIVMRFSLYSIIPGMILVIGTFEQSMYSLITVLITVLFMIIIILNNMKRIEKKWIYF